MALEVGHWTVWVTVFAVIAFQFILEVFLNIVMRAQVRITLDVLENLRDIGEAKDCIRNIFTNLAIVAALILTIAFAMLFVEFQDDHLNPDLEVEFIITHAFVAATSYAVIQSIRAMVESVLNLIYTEALTSNETIRFLIHGPGAVGAPVMAIGFSMASMLIATTLYVLLVVSVPAAVAFGILAGSRLLALGTFWLKRSEFNTNRESKEAKKWLWAESADERAPASVRKKCSSQEIEIMRLRCQEARKRDEEAKEREEQERALLRQRAESSRDSEEINVNL